MKAVFLSLNCSMQSGQDIAFSEKNFKAALVENTVLADKVAALENQLREQAEAYEKALLSIQEKFQLTKEQLEWLRRQMYGRKTERFVPSTDPKQLQLELEGLLQDVPEEAPVEEQTYKRKKGGKKPGQGRNQIPAHLERVVEEIVRDDIPEGAVKIGEEVTETLEIQEGKVYVKRIVRPKYTYPKIDGVHIAPLPPQAIPKGMAGSSMLAFILSNKYVYHLPLHRSRQMLRRHKVEVAASTMCGWTAEGSDLLIPLYDLVVKAIKRSGYVQGDETTIRVLDENKKGTHLGFYWAYGSPELNMVCFEYQKGRGREGPKAFLKGFKGTLQTDAWQVYDIFDHIEGILHIGCLAHARRKFEESKDNDYARAKTALELIKKLYKIEAEAREAEMDAPARKAHRDKHSTGTLKKLHAWLLENAPMKGGKVLPKSKIGKAISYALNNWEKLENCYLDGRHEIDNNYIENKIRPIAIGRKNYMFAGSHEAAQRAAVVYTLIATCKANDVDPTDWLYDVMARIPAMKVNEMEQLLPCNWKPLHQDKDNSNQIQ